MGEEQTGHWYFCFFGLFAVFDSKKEVIEKSSTLYSTHFRLEEKEREEFESN